jgi:D-alanine-D-alanine ligase
MSRVTVLTGGTTPERDVALAGAGQVVAALRAKGHDVTVVDTVDGTLSPGQERERLRPVGKEPPTLEQLSELAARELWEELTALPAMCAAEVIFPVLHGRQGEGGEMQALLERAGFAYAGSDPHGSALAMDKDSAKRRLLEAGIPTAPWCMWPAPEDEIGALGLPLIVKPSKAGSTVGLTVVEDASGVPEAVQVALAYDDEVMLEAYAPGREYTVGILDDEALAVGEIITSHDIFDYECKYTPGMAQEIFPAELERETAENMRRLGAGTHRALALRDFSRVDFRLAADGTPWVLEANTLPGLTATSLLPQSAAAVGIPFEELCHRICRMVLDRAGGGPGSRTGNRAETGTKGAPEV